MKQVTTFVGIDAHKKDLVVALLVGDRATPVTWQLANEPTAVRRLVRKLEREAPGPVHVFYEAGPCGYGLQRQMATDRIACDVIAPALMPRKPGERVKTNRRDARKLAELGRAGLLTVVRPPTPADEAVRDLARARDDAREDLQRGRHRLGKLLLRRGLHYAGKNWTPAHRRWVDSLTWSHAAERTVVEDYQLAIDHTEARLLELDARLAELAAQAPYREPVGWLRCFRGIDTLTAMLILAELHDFRRFGSALDGVPRTGARRRFQRRETSARAHHEDGQCLGPPDPGGGELALPASPGRRTRPQSAPYGPTGSSDRHRGQGATTLVPTVSTDAGGTQAGAEGGGRRGAGAGRLHLGRPATTRGRVDGRVSEDGALASRGDGCTSARFRGSAD
jgi:transposase